MYLRRLYDLPVLSVAGTLSITSNAPFRGVSLYRSAYDSLARLAVSSEIRIMTATAFSIPSSVINSCLPW